MESDEDQQKKSSAPESSVPVGKGFMWTQLTLRSLAIAFALCSITITVTSNQLVHVYGLVLQTRYTYVSSFKFLVGANAVACVFVLCSLISVGFCGSKSNPSLYFYVILNDVAMTALMISGCAAATAIGYVGRYGQNKSGWAPICDKTPTFCHKMTLALAFSYLSFYSLFTLTLISAYKLKSLAATAATTATTTL